MKRIIYKVNDEFIKDNVTYVLEKGVTEFYCESQYIPKLRELAKIQIISKDKSADIVLGKDIEYIEINDKKDELKVIELAKTKPVIVRFGNWKIIPIENILAETDNIIVEIDSFEEIQLCDGILEKGVSNFLINTDDFDELNKILNYAMKQNEKMKLDEIEIIDVKLLSVTDRVCIDSCNLMEIGQGFLIGSSCQCLFLVHAEVLENPYVASRPFRVNAGAIHSYIMVNENKTRYLSELKAGDDLVTVEHTGNTFENVVGRVKIEKRPMLLIRGKIQDEEYSVVLQNAETVCLVGANGKPIPVTKVKAKDKIKCYYEKIGRHFGKSVEETITER